MYIAGDNKKMLPTAVSHLLAGDSSEFESAFVRRAMLNGGLIVKQTHERIEGGTKVLEKSVVSYFVLTWFKLWTPTQNYEAIPSSPASLKELTL